MRRSTISGVLAAALAAMASGPASAAGFQLLEQNASGIANAYAGSAAIAENASTIFFNPAGMTRLPARTLSVGLAAVRPSFRFSNEGSQTGVLNAGTSDAGGWAAIPNGYVSWALDKDVHVGVGLGAPFGLMTEYDDDWAGAAHSTKFDIKTYNINPSIAWRVNDKLSLGAGVNWQRMEVEYVRRTGIVPVGGFPLPASFATLDAASDAWGWNVGVLLELTSATRVGLSYRSSIDHELKGDLKVKGPSPLFNAARSSNAKADVELPDTVILSAVHKLGSRWELLGDISRTGWSSIKKVDIVRTSGLDNGAVAQVLTTDFQDSWRYALGASYQYNDAWKLKFGIAYDESPVKDARRRLTSLPDNDRTWFSFGGQWRAGKDSLLDLGVAYLYIPDTSIENRDARDPLKGLVKGEYDSSVWILGAQYSLSF
ncbi:OmpP1/FadL family transporter [Thauera sinica]|uniref:OmpP1/FadL family transporter n=1 Tax=Thauera sinica TaxID=2665146 RepID=A0ABW1ATK2_9RHOO|nr:outer membrane protein transport protein [Thauera sp. K11]ATE61285.1 long-chain fatty acid transporter [Thauera sp. K11]